MRLFPPQIWYVRWGLIVEWLLPSHAQIAFQIGPASFLYRSLSLQHPINIADILPMLKQFLNVILVLRNLNLILKLYCQPVKFFSIEFSLPFYLLHCRILLHVMITEILFKKKGIYLFKVNHYLQFMQKKLKAVVSTIT